MMSKLPLTFCLNDLKQDGKAHWYGRSSVCDLTPNVKMTHHRTHHRRKYTSQHESSSSVI